MNSPPTARSLKSSAHSAYPFTLWRMLDTRLRAYLLYALGFGSLILLWHVLATYAVSSVFFPAPLEVAVRGVEMAKSGVLFEHIWASMQRILVGFFIGSVVGILIGLLMGTFEPVGRFLDPYIETLRFIPAVAMITIAVIWFGIGEASKIFIIFYGVIFVMVITTAAGVAGVAPNKIRAAQSLGASRSQIFWFVILPAAAPDILTGMRVAMANAFTIIVAAELVAAQQGIGAILWNARVMMLTRDIFVALVMLAILGFATDRLFRWLISAFAGRYSRPT